MALPKFALDPVVVGPGLTGRTVRRVYTTDLLDSGDFLVGGELVLTSMVWLHDDEDAERFVGVLAAAGAAGLVTGGRLLGRIPDSVIDACRAHDMPLLSASSGVSYEELSRVVIIALEREHGRRIAGTAEQQRLIVSATVAGGLSGLVEEMARVVGVPFLLTSLAGRAVVHSSPAPAIDAAVLAGAARRSPSVPALAPGPGGVWSVFPIGARTEPAAFLAGCGDAATWSEDNRVLVEMALELALLELGRERDREQTRRRLAGSTLQQVENDSDPVAAGLWFARHGLDPESPAWALAISSEGLPDWVDLGADLLDPASDGLGTVTIEDEEGTLVVLAADARGSIPQRIYARKGQLCGCIPPGAHIAIGAALASSGLSGMPQALQRARFANTLAARQPGPVRVVDDSGLATTESLLAYVPREIRVEFTDRLIGPLLRYDADHKADLLPTLRAFLECDGSWQAAAIRLHVHVNTLRYRIGRIGALTGTDPATVHGQANLFVALQAADWR
ncbi:MAG: PucR family transcriptional regulator ligand-binding domain-containing protein [Terrimesophilobacter sp.]